MEDIFKVFFIYVCGKGSLMVVGKNIVVFVMIELVGG